MQITSSPRRALGLVAVSALGMSTAVLGITGTAQAAPSTTTSSWTFSTDSAADVDEPGVDQIEIVSDGDCVIAWDLHGAGGGAGSNAGTPVAGKPGGALTALTDAYDGDVYDLFAGEAGDPATLSAAGTGGTNGYGSYEGQGGTDDGGALFGGGGGSAALVAPLGDTPFLIAFGGDGGGTDVGGPGGNYGENSDYMGTEVNGTPTNTGTGVISGEVTCEVVDPIAPGAPTLQDYVQVGDGTATFQFTPGSEGQDSDEQYVRSSWEYQLDGGAWTAFTEGYTGTDDLTGTLTGLTNKKTYSLKVRATSTAGSSAASAPVTFTPFAPVAAPTGVKATVGVSSVTISWTASPDAGVASYLAFATPEGAQSSQDTVFCETTGTSCTVAVKPGSAYWVGVVSRDSLGNEGGRASLDGTSAVVPATAISSTLPKSDGTLGTDTGSSVVAGESITMSGDGFLPGSVVELVIYSTPVKLGEAIVLADGTFTATVTLPEGMTNGQHHLVATGVDPDGNVRNLVVEVTVSGGTAVLASTGFSAAPVLGAGALALLAGGGLMVAARRRQTV